MNVARAAIIFAAALLLLGTTPPALADGEQPITITAIPPEGGETEHESVVLSARLQSDTGAVGGLPVTFYIVTNVFGERLMKVGEALTDAGGTVSVVYRPTWTGDHIVVAHFDGSSDYAAAETSYHFEAKEAESAYEPAEFGLEPVRAALPFAVGLAVLVVWGSLGFALVSTAMGIRTAARSAGGWTPVREPAQPVFIPPPEVSHDRTTPRIAILLAILLILGGVPLARYALNVSDESGENAPVSDGIIPDDHHGEPEPGQPFAASLVRSVQTLAFDENGQPMPGSVPMPADLGLTAGRVRILDSAGGRIVTVALDGDLIPIQQGRGVDGTSLKGSPAMSSQDEQLFIASASGDRVVAVDESGLIEGSIVPSLPAAQNPPEIGGIAVTGAGTIWLSDVANNRVILLNSHGEFELVIGHGTVSDTDESLDAPTGLAVDRNGNLYVSDTGNHVIKKFSPLGVLLQEIGEGHLEAPRGLTVSAAGWIFVADTTARQIAVFAPDGSYQGSITDPGFEEPHIVRLDRDLIYVLDRLAGMLVFQASEDQLGIR